jgi:hypothetical protein
MRQWHKRKSRHLKGVVSTNRRLFYSVFDIHDDIINLQSKHVKPSNVLKNLEDEITESGILNSNRQLVVDPKRKTFVTPKRLENTIRHAYANGDLTLIFETYIIPYAAWVDVSLDTHMNRMTANDKKRFMAIGDWIRSRTPPYVVDAVHRFWL